MKAYISIPISGRPLIDAKCQAERIKAKLTEHGHECITPFDVCPESGKPYAYYGISKRFNEDYARCYHPRATGVRFHNVYGPRPRQGTLLWHLLNQERVKLYNMGRNVRHFTYIDDIVESLVYAYGCNHQLINAANPEETTTLHFAELVKQYKPLEIEMIAEERDFDRKEQSVNEAVYTVPLQYTPVADGIRRIFESMDYEQTQ